MAAMENQDRLVGRVSFVEKKKATKGKAAKAEKPEPEAEKAEDAKTEE